MTGVLHIDVLASGLPWAQDGYRDRAWTTGDPCWMFTRHQRVASEARRWYRAVITRPALPGMPYPKARFVDGPWDGEERTEYVANFRDDLPTPRP